MTSKEAYDIALKIAEVYSKNLQFFVAICTLFGGWIVVNGLSDSSAERALLFFAFVGPTVALLIGQVQLVRRADAAIKLSRRLLVGELDSDVPAEVKPLFNAGENASFKQVTQLGMGIVIVAVALLIVFAEPVQKATEKIS